MTNSSLIIMGTSRPLLPGKYTIQQGCRKNKEKIGRRSRKARRKSEVAGGWATKTAMQLFLAGYLNGVLNKVHSSDPYWLLKHAEIIQFHGIQPIE